MIHSLGRIHILIRRQVLVRRVLSDHERVKLFGSEVVHA